jgi:hypothetical protein
MSRHRPAYDPAAEGVEHQGEIQESCPGRDVGDVSYPQAIRFGCDEVAIDQIRRPDVRRDHESWCFHLRRLTLTPATPAARIALRLRYPVANRLVRRLELLREFVGTTPSAHQLYRSASVFRRIPCMTLGHRGSPSFPHSATVHSTGSTPKRTSAACLICFQRSCYGIGLSGTGVEVCSDSVRILSKRDALRLTIWPSAATILEVTSEILSLPTRKTEESA